MNISVQATSVITTNNLPVELEGTVLKTFSAWSEQGFLRKLDSALAIFVQQLDPLAAPVVVVAAGKFGAA